MQEKQKPSTYMECSHTPYTYSVHVTGWEKPSNKMAAVYFPGICNLKKFALGKTTLTFLPIQICTK